VFQQAETKGGEASMAAKMSRLSFETEEVIYDNISSINWAPEGSASKIVESEQPGDFKPRL
jgi:hypothetical protein